MLTIDSKGSERAVMRSECAAALYLEPAPGIGLRGPRGAAILEPYTGPTMSISGGPFGGGEINVCADGCLASLPPAARYILAFLM
jgi:hypothetical protein